MTRFELLLHQRVQAELRALRGRHKKYAGAVETLVRKLLADPHGAGTPLRGITQPELQGQLLRLRVGGRRGHRVFYWVTAPREDTDLRLVIPLFVSEATRSRFDYDDIDVNAVGMDIVDDYRAEKFDRFRRFGTADAVVAWLALKHGDSS